MEPNNDIYTIELVDIRVNHECNDVFTFGLTYHITYKDGKIEEIELPRVTNPFYGHARKINQFPWHDRYIETMSQCILESVRDERNNMEYYSKRKVIKKAVPVKEEPVEMTMDEIETALGKRVKIVNKGDKKC